jgi:uncharacterized protein YegP (UPF0339 family)
LIVGASDVFEIFRDDAGKYRWRLKTEDEIVAVSEAYEAKQGAIASAHKVPEWSSSTPVRDLTQ